MTRTLRLSDRLRALFVRVRNVPGGDLAKSQETHWETEDYLGELVAAPLVKDPWETDPENYGSTPLRETITRIRVAPAGRSVRSTDSQWCGSSEAPAAISPSAVREEPRSIGAAAQAQNQPAPTAVSDLPISPSELPECGLSSAVATDETLELGSPAAADSVNNQPSFSQADDLRINLLRYNPDPDEIDRLDEQLTPHGATRGETLLDGDEWDTPNETPGAKNPEEDFEEQTFDEAVQDCALELKDEGVFLDPAANEPLDYDPDARQQLWGDNECSDKSDEDGTRRAREKAASIASIVEVTNRRDQKTTLEWLTEFFLEFRHPATFRAIERIAVQNITPDLLRAVIALRRYWMERPEWWISRSDLRREAHLPCKRSNGLGWALALRVCRCRPEYPPEDMIDDGWFAEWLALSPRTPGYFAFAEYVGAKVSDPDSQLLYEGLTRRQHDEGEPEIGDDLGWWRKLARYDESVRFGFNVLTPFRDLFGPPGYPET